MDTIFEIKHLEGVRYIEEGEGETLLCLYGLFGSLKNFYHQIEFFKKSYKVIVPDLPLLEQNIFSTNINGIVDIVEKFIKHKNLKDINLIGNSLGGHIALNYTLANSQQVKSLILTGSSGLFEHGMGDSYPKKGDYNFIKNKVEFTFYNPEVQTKNL